jgi:hypothetical protein
MAIEYWVEPKQMNGNVVETTNPGEPAEFYGVYARGIKARWGLGGLDDDAAYLANHLGDFPTREAAQAFMEHLQSNAPQLEALMNREPVTVAGVRYLPTEGNKRTYTAEGNAGAGFQTPVVATWEIDRYLKTGELSPELAANAAMHPENLASLNEFDRWSMRNMAESLRHDPHCQEFNKIEAEYIKAAGGFPGEGYTRVRLDDLPREMRKFVQNPQFGDEAKLDASAEAKPPVAAASEAQPTVASPLGGLDMKNMAEGATVIYSRADAPDTPRIGVLMHNESTSGGNRLDILNDQGLRERLYTGPDQGHEGEHNRLAAVVGYAMPTTEPLFVAGVGADGKIVDRPQDAQSFGVFYHDQNGEAVPVGQAVTAGLAEQLKDHIEQGRVPEPIDTPKTISSLGELRNLLDLPPQEKVEAAPPAPSPQPENPQPDDQKKPENPQQQQNPQQQNPQQQQQVVQQIGFLSLLLMHTVNAGKLIVQAIRGPDAEEWKHRAHAHMDRAQAHLDAIASHPAVQQYQTMQSLPNMPERAKALYADTLLRNNPDLAAHYAQARDSVDKAQDAMFYMNRKGGKTDPELTNKAAKVYQTASKLPDMENGSSGGLFASLKSFFSAQHTQTMHKP